MKSLCIKTGGWVFLSEYNAFYRGDLFTVGNVLVVKVSPNSFAVTVPQDEPIWATIHDLEMDIPGVNQKVFISSDFTVYYKLMNINGKWEEVKVMGEDHDAEESS